MVENSPAWRNDPARRAGAHLAFAAVVAAAAALAQEEPFRPSVSVAPEAVAPGGSATITVSIAIAAHHFLYVDQLSLQPGEAAGLTFGRAVMPKGEPKLDPFLGPTQILKERATLSLPVTVEPDAAPGERAVKLRLRYQGCTDRACFPPAQADLTATLKVGAPTEEAALDAAFAAAGPARGAAGKPFTVTAAVEPARVAPGQKAVVKITFGIADKHHLYANETSVAPQPAPGITFGKVSAPAGETKVDPYLGPQQIYKKRAVLEVPLVVARSAEPGARTLRFTARYMGCDEKSCFPPESVEVEARLEVAGPAAAEAATLSAAPAGGSEPGSAEAELDRLRQVQERFGLLGVLLVAFAAGLGLSLTPCVYPMIPVTVGVIGASGAKNKAQAFALSLLFVLGMSVTYAALGAAAASSGALFGSYGNHPAVRATVAGIFVLLGLSMFDLFYIQMPSSIQSKLAGRKGAGLAGVFVTGLAAGAMVGPCVGPFLLGILLYIAQLGDKVAGFLIMWSVALGMGVLFVAVGTFAGAAAALPKPGRWMDAVKHFFGILLFGLALFYLKTVLPAGVFALGVDAYLVGVGVFVASLLAPSAGSASKAGRLGRVLLVAGLAVGAAYVTRLALGGRPAAKKAEGISWLTDEAAARAAAREQGKPMMIDFRADWCTYCLKLEAETFPDPQVVAEAKRFVALKVDCPAGDAAAEALQRKYGVRALPSIVFVDSKGEILADKMITEFVTPAALVARMREVR